MVELLSPNDNEVTANSGMQTPDAPDTSDTTSPAESAIEESPSESEKSPNGGKAEKASKDSKKSNTYQAKSSVSRKASSKVKEPDTPSSTTKPKSAPKSQMAASKSTDKETNRIAEARAKNLDLAISQIQKDFGEAAIMRLGTDTHMDVEVIPTGNLIIDRALGAGGFPRGRIVEVYGPESSGKTTLTLTAIAQAQKAGGLAAFVDVEHALDPQYARRLGVDLDNLLLSQPSSGEEALRIVETLVRSNALDVIVLDSVAALVTKQELDGEIGDATVGAQARLMSAALRKLTSIISKARTVVIFTNQIREKVGVMFGNPETQPGGRALKFYSSVRCDIRRIGSIKGSDGTVSGNRTRLKIVKNKVAPPYGEAEFDIMFNEGISAVGSLLDLAIEHEILQKRGSWISYKGSQLAQGRDAAKEALKADDALYAEVEAEVKAVMDAGDE
ncbi:MAG: recombinase RecA [Verrucomicrobiales bacterium]|nr:recombinase RecA [Verrucomicrobiales bacterium]